ncbi:MAG: hypothetical protein GY705_17940 [Bacteroidetes bacterium]|nr:hypothetical protein [Bacteroidota bacterium]
MASNDKTFYYYFKENMNSICPGIACPETVFGNLSATVINIGLMADWVRGNYGKKFGDMLQQVSKLAAIGAASSKEVVVGRATLVSRAALAFAELYASFYTGCCIGSTLVAGYKVGKPHYKAYFESPLNDPTALAPAFNGRFPNAQGRRYTGRYYSITGIGKFCKQHNIQMSSEIQKVFHKYPELRKCH